MDYLVPLISAGMRPNAICDCDYFAKYLMNWVYGTISEDDELSIWIAFEKNMKEYLMMFTRSSGKYCVVSCSVNISSALLKNLEVLRRNGMALSTILISIISAIYLTEIDKDCFFAVRDIQNHSWFFRSHKEETDQVLAALRGRFDFMKLLVAFGSVKSLPAESYILYKETQKIIREFIGRAAASSLLIGEMLLQPTVK